MAELGIPTDASVQNGGPMPENQPAAGDLTAPHIPDQEERRMREVHGPEEQDTPSAVHPAFPVHVGDVSHAEQTNRQVLLAQAIPSDLLATDRLMATE